MEITFTADPAAIGQVRRLPKRYWHPSQSWDFVYEQFHLPVRVMVHGHCLLGGNGERFPLIHLARGGLTALQETLDVGAASYRVPDIGWGFRLCRQGDGVIVTPNSGGPSRTVPVRTFFHAWRDFDRRVARYLADEVPNIMTIRDLAAWVRGDWPYNMEVG